MGTASATPAKLIGYASEMEQAVGTLNSWMSGALRPAIQAYQKSAIDFGTGEAGRAVELLGSTGGKLTELHETDNQVGLTGQAFQMVENQNSPLAFNYGDPLLLNTLLNPNGIVTTTDDKVEQAAYQTGVNLAHNLPKMSMGQVKAMLMMHVLDPSFMGGFLNNLTQGQLKALIDATQPIGEPADPVLQNLVISGIVSAFHGDMVTDSTRRNLDKILSDTPPITAPLLNALTKDPTAAKNFVRDADPSLWKHLMQGGPQWDLNKDVQKATLQMLTSAVQGMELSKDPLLQQHVSELIKAVGENLHTTTAENIDFLKDDIKHLLVTAGGAIAVSPDGYPGGLNKWARDMGAATRPFNDFYEWMNKSYEASAKDSEFTHEVIATMVLEVGLSIVMPEAIPEILAAANAGWIAPSVVGPLVKAWPTGVDGKTTATTQEAVSFYMTWALSRQMYTNNLIVGPDGKTPIPWESVPGHDDPEEFIKNFRDDKGVFDPATVKKLQGSVLGTTPGINDDLQTFILQLQKAMEPTG